MSKLDALIGNPHVEEHLIHYIGFVHLHRCSSHFIDPISPHEPELQAHYLKSLREGAYGDLKIALMREVDLSPEDENFKAIVRAAIDELVARKGMDAIVRASKAFIWEMEGRAPEILPQTMPYFPSSDLASCSKCGRIRVPLGMEDLPEVILEMQRNAGCDLVISWHCLKCHVISNE
jgi:hypothetical protein